MSKTLPQLLNKDPNRLQHTGLVVLLIVLFVAGGSARADQAGQIIVRGAAWLCLLLAVSFCDPGYWRSHLRAVRVPAAFVLICAALPALQLVPLPPTLWTALPLRDFLAQVAGDAGVLGVWRPLSLSPGATLNALNSLIVPFSVLLLAGPHSHRSVVFKVVLAGIYVGALIGAVQLAGSSYQNPLINDDPDIMSGLLANRNHFALLNVIGSVLTCVWALGPGRIKPWKAGAGLLGILLLALCTLAAGSRMGLALLPVGLVLGLLTVTRIPRSFVSQISPRRIAIGAGLMILLVAGGAFLAYGAGRAFSVERMSELQAGEDLRFQAWPAVIAIIARLFPFGAGFGTFDPNYRMFEPDSLLGPTYFNHAHNDYLEIAVDGGVIAVIVLLVSVGWWIGRGLKVWRRPEAGQDVQGVVMGRTGWSIILLVLLASIVDYPARTPLFMALVVIAAVWMVQESKGNERAIA